MGVGEGRYRRTQRIPDPRTSTGAMVVAAKRAACRDGVRTPSGQSGSFRGLKLVPSKWRYLVPPTSGYPKGFYANADR
jgi:hypothetical protein